MHIMYHGLCMDCAQVQQHLYSSIVASQLEAVCRVKVFDRLKVSAQ